MTYNGRHKFEHCNEYNADGGTPTYGGYSQCVVVDETPGRNNFRHEPSEISALHN